MTPFYCASPNAGSAGGQERLGLLNRWSGNSCWRSGGQSTPASAELYAFGILRKSCQRQKLYVVGKNGFEVRQSARSSY